MTGGSGERTLESVEAGETVTLRRFAFPTLRAVCEDIGLVPGRSVRCRVRAPGVLLLEREDGTHVRIDTGWARLIEISAVPVATEAA
jgi:hypothetical protein